MSSGNPVKKRRIVKTLDFEDCVVANVKTKRKTKVFRAKLTREVENLEDSPKEEEKSPESPILSQSTRQKSQTSPVLIGNSATVKTPSSPILRNNNNKRKLQFDSDEDNSTPHPPTTSPRKSPVFKVKTSKHKPTKPTTTSQNEKTEEDERTIESIESSQKTSTTITELIEDSSYQIEDDFTQESKPNVVEISSVESQNLRSTFGSESYSVDATSETEETETLLTQTGLAYDHPKECVVLKEVGRRNFKKNTLLGRLEKLARKQASEKLLWQHQRQRNNSNDLKKLSVITFWNEETSFVLKCRSHSSPAPADSEINFLFVNSQWVPNVKRIKEGSVLRLHPPWQKMSVPGLGGDAILNVICMEILNEEIKMAAEDKIHYEPLPVDEYETNQKLFVDSLFPSYTTPFLY